MLSSEFECGPGWFALIEPLVRRCESMGGAVMQIKEKFGALRFYFDVDGEWNEDWDAFQQAVDDATLESLRTCELCGKPGRPMSKGGWLKTVCKDHAEKLGYKWKHDNPDC